MQVLEFVAPPPKPTGAAPDRGSWAPPDFVVADHGGMGLIAARARRRHLRLEGALHPAGHLLSYCESAGAACTMVLDGVCTKHRLLARAVTFVPAGRAVQWTVPAHIDIAQVDLYIPDRLIGARPCGQVDWGLAPPLVNMRDPWLVSYFQLMIAEFEDGARGKVESSTFLDDTGVLLIRHLGTLLRSSSASQDAPWRNAPRVSALRPHIIGRINAFVHTNLSNDIRLERLADIAGMSVDHFVRTFRTATGSTPHQYVLERRLDRACAMLRNSAEKVSVIAQRCGFAGAAHFSAIFRHHRGLTPTQYRRLH